MSCRPFSVTTRRWSSRALAGGLDLGDFPSGSASARTWAGSRVASSVEVQRHARAVVTIMMPEA